MQEMWSRIFLMGWLLLVSGCVKEDKVEAYSRRSLSPELRSALVVQKTVEGEGERSPAYALLAVEGAENLEKKLLADGFREYGEQDVQSALQMGRMKFASELAGDAGSYRLFVKDAGGLCASLLLRRDGSGGLLCYFP